MRKLARKCVLVTGAAHRESIGWEIARCLAEEGADLVISDIDREDEAAELAQEIKAIGSRVAFVKADVTKVSECRLLAEKAFEAFGQLDVLVNNAGLSTHQSFLSIKETDFDLMLNVNLKGPFFLTQAVVPRLPKGGRIINISSEQAYIGHPTLPHYSAAKAGLLTMTRSLAIALAPDITVNCVAPGPTATARFRAGPAYTNEIRNLLPLKRWVEPRDVGRSVVFLASADGNAFTGQVLDPNCGAVMP